MPAPCAGVDQGVAEAAALERALRAVLPAGGLGCPLWVESDLPSTSDRLRELAMRGAPEGATVVAWTQSAGRGRHGRRWHSPPGLGLYFSVLLRPDWPARDAAWLSALGALAVREALRAGGGAASVKPPNDVRIGPRKIAGILAEPRLGAGRVEFAVLGIGLNVGHGPADWRGTPLDGRAISCREAGLDWTPAEAARAVLAALDARYAPLRNGGAGRLAHPWREAGGDAPPGEAIGEGGRTP